MLTSAITAPGLSSRHDWSPRLLAGEGKGSGSGSVDSSVDFFSGSETSSLLDGISATAKLEERQIIPKPATIYS